MQFPSCPKWCPSVVHMVPKWCQVVSIYVTISPRDVLSECRHNTILNQIPHDNCFFCVTTAVHSWTSSKRLNVIESPAVAPLPFSLALAKCSVFGSSVIHDVAPTISTSGLRRPLPEARACTKEGNQLHEFLSS